MYGSLQVVGDALNRIRHLACVGFAFDDAGPGDEEERAGADRNVADFKFVIHKNQ